jgi:hypothetical protein
MIIKYTEYIKENNSDSQFFTTYEETKKWLDKMSIDNYTINHDLTVDVDGIVNISAKNLTNIPVQFGTVKGNFYCSYNKLTTLYGSPKEVKGNLYCYENKLTTLEGSPKEVNGYFYCNDENQLTTLEGLSIYNLKKNIDRVWYKELNPKIKEEWFNEHLEDNPEIIGLIGFKPSKKFKDKWEHLLNANKFDLI